MGIKNLNRYLIDRCSKHAIYKSHLKIAEGKTLVIDASIYIYKYISQNSLIEYMYLMISILLEYNITPIFVFDGKAPPEKRELLRERSKQKKNAEIKYNDLKKEVEKNELSTELKKDILEELDSLKKKFIRIKETDLVRVKKLMDAYGISYIIADGEADKLCASLVKTGKAWACLSDDMDMFVYGCPRVFRHMSLLKHTIIMYDFNQILTELHLSEKEFREILVLSGTDYNVHQNVSLFETMRWFNEYSMFSKCNNLNESFYKWLFENEMRVVDYDELNKVLDMFYLDESIYINQCIIARVPNYIDLHNILKEDGFIMC